MVWWNKLLTPRFLAQESHDYRRFQGISVAIFRKEGREIFEGDAPPDQQLSWHCSIAEKLDRLPHVTGSMMTDTEERDLIVMNAMRFELHFFSGRATSEKTYAPAFPHHRSTQRPGLWFTNYLDYTIGAAMAGRSATHRRDCIWFMAKIDDVVRAGRSSEAKPFRVSTNHEHAGTRRFERAD